ncbi:4-diphosphocytidyl-2-C-methyl-D-erythritol kinase [Sphingomonas sp. PP-F2F-G114-C0414]|uniref:4-(cytidine 5'-diphospho)-2-C-methyl-D-erythritol kinase n=1 Tax=Sphingomonas sp. PP-F2F-G114-C0414 TaxID=2135662 RepID=UPI000EF88B4C|nr:4-(cytidine 5'-diphospho)-2-C-methyl-D-erythritol kinase [Sphingomonas sp. PP-F2F-G114-C0414]RMB28605.1 4-diphosphocytidyl-2-C-methyl-D-erythritol kinase [Sphingomonas sp. PP-F2F-G114-C0414]
MPAITEPASAKINLALHVRRRRPDGYHDLETLFAFATDGDLITVEPAQTNSFTITGPFAAALLPNTPPAKAGAQLGTDNDEAPRSSSATPGNAPWQGNLVTAAADAFTTAFAPEAHHAITLEKHLPIASGIGGGSADAAATLRALARLHGVPPTDPRLHDIAAKLGADVPACLANRTTLGTGKGDTLTTLEGLSGTPLLLVNPGVAVSTAAVFKTWDGHDLGPIPEGNLLDRALEGRNDLERPALALAPAIAEVRTLLDKAHGVLLSRMSGSGATCFALFETPETRNTAATAAQAKGWWTLATTLA